ncbi:hypothetical protein LIPSTDRAFT_192669 [Lipomyces starkeyi NRRL Y-11557]|uniref:Uncharacterized protein n=1 Tax=Lipomyces starkeyi NRRL Y-11557 TaxID=675824 RepID=A0A1E3PW33_LIPST|nr:hypothetical protein LIPSTDRAFT_192669 [Lipomyces starkeyi NRRL Y-11557]
MKTPMCRSASPYPTGRHFGCDCDGCSEAFTIGHKHLQRIRSVHNCHPGKIYGSNNSGAKSQGMDRHQTHSSFFLHQIEESIRLSMQLRFTVLPSTGHTRSGFMGRWAQSSMTPDGDMRSHCF